MFRRSFLCFSLCPLSLGTPEKRLTQSPLHFPFCFFAYFDKILKNLLFSRLNSPSSLALLICEMLQSLNHLCGPLLDSLCYAHVSFLGRPKLDTAVQTWRHPCWREGKDHCSWPAGNTPAQAAQDLVLLAARAYLVAVPCSAQCPPGPSLQSYFPGGWPQHGLVHVVIPSQDLVICPC